MQVNDSAKTQQIFGIDVDKWSPTTPQVVDAGVLGYPRDSLRDVPAGQTVGYGGAWRAARDSRMAVVAAGYGDGYPRSVESGTPLLVNGLRAPIAGRVSMDMITVDVTDLPGVATGDPVVLWGEGVPVEDIARHAGTIPYELICGVSQRVQLELR